jgi:hypothetical protein
MNQQLAIVFNPTANTRTVEGAQLPKQFDNAGLVIQVTAATATLYSPGGTQMFQGSILDGKVVNNNGELTTIWDVDTTTALLVPKVNYKIIWDVDGVFYTRWYDVVYWKMVNPISELDLLIEKPEIDKYRPERKLRINTIVSPIKYVCDQLSEPDDFWIGSIFESNSKFVPDAVKRVVDWETDTKTLTLDSAFTPSDMRQGDYFMLRRGFYPEIQSSWISIQEMINSWAPKFSDSCTTVMWTLPWSDQPDRSNKNYPVDSFDFRKVHLYQTMIYIARALRLRLKDEFDIWESTYGSLFGKALAEIKAKVDANNTGIPNLQRTGQIWLSS